MNVLPFRYLQRLPAREIISKLPIEVTVNKEPRFKVVSLDSQNKTTVSIDDSHDKQISSAKDTMIGDIKVEKISLPQDDKPIYHGTWLCKKHQSFVCSCKQSTEKK